MWEGSMADQRILRVAELRIGAKPEVRVLALRRCVDPTSLVATEWSLLVVVGHDVLAEFGADPLQEIPKTPHHGVVPSHRMFGLHEIDHSEHNDQDEQSKNNSKKSPPDHGVNLDHRDQQRGKAERTLRTRQEECEDHALDRPPR